jgi:hypothetical protein
MDQAHGNGRRPVDGSASKSSQAEGQTSHFKVMSPPATSPFEECDINSEQVKFLI